MERITRSLARLTVTTARHTTLLSRPSLLPSSSSSAAPISFLRRSNSIPSRTYATEPSHLGNLAPAPGSNHKRKRIGRGIGSGRGGTSGRGHKGQGARSGNGKPKLHFAGGQTPITRAFPKRGFTNPLRKELTPLNLDRLQHWIDLGRIDPTVPITMKELFESRCVHGIKHGVKLLGDGAEYFTSRNVSLEVSKASSSAIKAIQALDGNVTARYENRLTLRALINPSSFERRNLPLPGKADPVSRSDILYYSDIKKRGYLALRDGKVAPTTTVAEEKSEEPTVKVE